jgi:uncharacterized repeat protein (TIGR02543 family)
MAGKVGRWGVVLLLAALALGVSGAGGQALATTTIVVQVSGQGSVTGGGGQINCGNGGTSCYATYVSGDSVTLTASAATGWTFTGWDDSDDCSGSSPSCSVPLNGTSREEIAAFTPATPGGESTLTVSKPIGGVVEGVRDDIDCGSHTDDCDSSMPTGSTLTLTETPDTGYTFSGWGGACSGTANHCTVTMDTDRDVSATFTQSAATHLLTVSVMGNGTVTGGGVACTASGGSGCTASEAAGSVITLTAIPGSGGDFIGWGGACAGTSTTCQVSMTSDISVSAAFSGGTGSTVPLTVSVTGNGTVSGGGINCGSGGTTCSADLTTGSNVTLTAIPAPGATLEAWAGACSGSARTCTVTMNAAKAVSVTFTTAGQPTNTVTLTLHVAGNGAVSAPGGTCSGGGGTKTCTQSYEAGASVVLTARAGAGATFVRWSGACTGTKATCTLTLGAARAATATFTASHAGVPSGTLRSRGRPIVERERRGFAVTLRFTTTQQGTAQVRALRAGRVMMRFSFPVTPGPVTIGPFSVARSGYYTFQVAVGSRAISWTACLGRCGEAATGRRFTVTREVDRVIAAGAAWSVTVNFRTTLPADVQLRVYRATALALAYHLARPAGRLSAGPFLLSPGNYTLRLTATDAYGRVRTLSWFALLP